MYIQELFHILSHIFRSKTPWSMPRKYVKKNVGKKYDDHTLNLAVEGVANGLSIREASGRFRVPYTTLNRHVNNEVLFDRIGRPSKFTKEEEDCLEQAAIALQVR